MAKYVKLPDIPPAVPPGKERQVMSLQMLVESSRNDREFVEELLDMYQTEFSNFPLVLREYVGGKNMRAFRDLLHRILPSVQRLTRGSLEQELQELKQHILDNTQADAAKTEQMLQQIEKSCGEVLAEIHDIRQHS